MTTTSGVDDRTACHWQAFTQTEYRALLAQTRALYSCVGFELVDGDVPQAEKTAIIRHDVDMSPDRALDLARIEHELGVRATYTVLMTGGFYNPFEPHVRDQFKQIAALGHDIGLHFDAAWHQVKDEAGLHEGLSWEAETLGRLLGVPVEMFSFHNTTAFTMACQADHYAGLRNAYAGQLQRHVSYTSDSNGCWRFRTWAELLEEGPSRIQVLTHPEWWVDVARPPAEKVMAILDERARLGWEDYCALLERGPRPNHSEIPLALARLGSALPDGSVLRMWLSGRREAAFVTLVHEVERQRGCGGTSSVKTVYAEVVAGKSVPAERLVAAFEDAAYQLTQ